MAASWPRFSALGRISRFLVQLGAETRKPGDVHHLSCPARPESVTLLKQPAAINVVKVDAIRKRGGRPQVCPPSLPFGSTLVPCVQQFYDQHNYGWLALQNKCRQAVSVTFVGANSSAGVWGSMNLESGEKKSTGHDQLAVASAGAVTLYVCPKGYDPVDAMADKVIGAKEVAAYT